MVMAHAAKESFAHISPVSGRKASHIKYDSAISRQSLAWWCEGNSDAQNLQNAPGYGQQIAETQKCRSKGLRKPHWRDQILTTAW